MHTNSDAVEHDKLSEKIFLKVFASLFNIGVEKNTTSVQSTFCYRRRSTFVSCASQEIVNGLDITRASYFIYSLEHKSKRKRVTPASNIAGNLRLSVLTDRHRQTDCFIDPFQRFHQGNKPEKQWQTALELDSNHQPFTHWIIWSASWAQLVLQWRFFMKKKNFIDPTLDRRTFLSSSMHANVFSVDRSNLLTSCVLLKQWKY